MARKHDVSELLRRITALEKYTIATGTKLDTNIATTPVAAGDATLTVASITNAADTDYIALVGQSGAVDLLRVGGTPSSGSIPLAYKSKINAAVGSRVVEMTRTVLGDLDDSGVTVNSSAQLVDVTASTSLLPIFSFITGGTLGFSANMREMSIENWLVAHGIPEAQAAGAGTASDPFGAAITGLTMGTEALTIYRCVGLMADGVTTMWADFGNAVVAPNTNTQLGGSQPGSLGLSGRATCFVPRLFS
jgi:hypothetical protein